MVNGFVTQSTRLSCYAHLVSRSRSALQVAMFASSPVVSERLDCGDRLIRVFHFTGWKPWDMPERGGVYVDQAMQVAVRGCSAFFESHNTYLASVTGGGVIGQCSRYAPPCNLDLATTLKHEPDL